MNPIIHWAGQAYLRHLFGGLKPKPGPLNERPIEYAYVFRSIAALQPMTIADVGTGTSALPALLHHCRASVTAFDNVKGYWPKGMFNRHYPVQDEDITNLRTSAQFDLVLCISVIEHIPDLHAAMTGLFRLARPNSHIIVTTPLGAERHPNVYKLPGSRGGRNPYSCRQSSLADFDPWKESIQDIEYWKVFDSAFWSVGAQLPVPERSSTPAHLACMLLQKPA